MADIYDVVSATEGSASLMTSTFCEYGNGSMRHGILKYGNAMFAAGSVMTLAVISLMGTAIWGGKKIVDKWNKHKSICVDKLKKEDVLEDVGVCVEEEKAQ